jgi:hypothetical protein
VSDRLCAEYDLSVITEKSGQRGKSYAEYQADKFGTSWKTLLRKTLDAAIRSSDTFDSFLSFMKDAGYEIKRGKYISFRATGQERFTRAKTVGDNYTEEHIRQRITEPKKMMMPKWIKPTTKKIIDRSNKKIQSSPGYRQWAAMHNIQAMAATLNYLSEHHGNSLEDFERHYANCVAQRDAAHAAFDQAAKQIAADSSLGVGERIKRHNALKTRHAKEVAALNTEIVEMDRIRANVISVHGDGFYKKHSRRREMEI